MLALVTSETNFSDVVNHTDDIDADWEYEELRLHLKNLKSKDKANFKAREMFPLVRDMWFYSENITTGDVQIQFRGKGMLSRKYWPAEMNSVTIVTYNLLRKKLGLDINEV